MISVIIKKNATIMAGMIAMIAAIIRIVTDIIKKEDIDILTIPTLKPINYSPTLSGV